MKYSGKLTLQPRETIVSEWLDWPSSARSMMAVHVDSCSRSGGVEVTLERWCDESARVTASCHKLSASVGSAWALIDATDSRQVRLRWESRSNLPAEIRFDLREQPMPNT